jgi:hypothetical protein
LARQQRVEHRTRRHAGDIGGDGGQFEIGVLEPFLDAVDAARPFLHQRRAGACELAHLALGCRRHAAHADYPMAQEIGDPFGGAHVRLASGHGFLGAVR